jgi:hypothetical protein
MAEKEYPTFNVYRGLQKPLILFGMKGQNIYWGAGTFLTTVIAVGIGLSFFGFLVGLIMGCGTAGIGAYKISQNIKKGLHNRKEMKGIWVVKNLVKPTL